MRKKFKQYGIIIKKKMLTAQGEKVGVATTSSMEHEVTLIKLYETGY